MANVNCPAYRDESYHKVALVIQSFRFVETNEYNITEMEQLKGKRFWDNVTRVFNGNETFFPREYVLGMAKSIASFHSLNSCNCVGKVVCEILRDRGSPSIPTPQECLEWNRVDMAAEPIQQINKSSMSLTCETGSSKRMRIYDPVQTKVCDVDYTNTCAISTKQARSDVLINIMEHYRLPKEMKNAMLLSLSLNGELIPIVTKLDEDSLFAWLKGISSKDVYEKWFEEWNSSDKDEANE